MDKRLKKKKPTEGKKLQVPQSDPIPSDSLHPVFSFKYLQEHFGITTCDPIAFILQLKQVSQITWGAWKQCPREGMGFEKIARTSIKTEVPQDITSDVKHFLSFRFNNGRVVGYRNGMIFYIIWTDGTFKLYKH